MSGNDKIKVRNIGIVCPGEGTTVWVDHVWETRPCGHGCRDEGAVGLMLEAGGQQLGVFGPGGRDRRVMWVFSHNRPDMLKHSSVYKLACR